MRTGSALSNRSIQAAPQPYILNPTTLINEKLPIHFNDIYSPNGLIDIDDLNALERRNKEIVNWNSLNLSACFQVNIILQLIFNF